jgi:ABC-2 type transport system ATP-binding protein
MVKSNEDLIKCVNISKQFGFFFALKNISFSVNGSIIFGIAGANGAGKTTLIKILSGILKPTHGKIVIKDLNYVDNPNEIKKVIGITTDESFLYEELTIFENLKFYDNLHYNFKKNETLSKVEHFAKLLNLSDWIHEPIRNLSHGMKKKVELIRVLIHKPSIIFLDEPFSGLDYKTTEFLIKFFKELSEKENVSVILTSHKMDIFSQICDEIIILKQGRISKSLTKDEYREIEIEPYF